MHGTAPDIGDALVNETNTIFALGVYLTALMEGKGAVASTFEWAPSLRLACFLFQRWEGLLGV